MIETVKWLDYKLRIGNFVTSVCKKGSNAYIRIRRVRRRLVVSNTFNLEI